MSTLRATKFVQRILSDKLAKECNAIDATMGNGYDTLFLANSIGTSGKLFSFDIQETALINTKNLLDQHGFEKKDNLFLINDSHANILKYVNEPIDVAMFNFGYLPGGNHEIVTKPQSSITALKSVMQLLKKKGIISLIIYYGHIGGEIEKNKIIDFINTLNYNEFSVLHCSYLNQDNNPPIIILIEKK
ncbi:class I SAM-dependent methyltransferase [Serpentinicella sp. ANB-PHB4]|uniref:tRNA (mnm(5)s(2)U34)-methyltransferase n=1 Tax=Serpentinicella sp. ANB-PHB4 TaxID=3074076 RepID=UPI002859F684|nr:class I SAM-dependent methyltransferase [Serpentinicella sp. ANB-PHB4]MDR5658139.1 class I SAM-dependent methyltransferase [Serpentinicella sp. ANB-PHB4]